MKFTVPKSGNNLLNKMRQLGYKPDRNKFGDTSFSRPLQGSPYPKFHIYVNDGIDAWTLNLHLDQKKPSYEGSAAHAGEYEGSVVEQELRRIQSLISY